MILKLNYDLNVKRIVQVAQEENKQGHPGTETMGAES